MSRKHDSCYQNSVVFKFNSFFLRIMTADSSIISSWRLLLQTPPTVYPDELHSHITAAKTCVICPFSFAEILKILVKIQRETR